MGSPPPPGRSRISRPKNSGPGVDLADARTVWIEAAQPSLTGPCPVTRPAAASVAQNKAYKRGLGSHNPVADRLERSTNCAPPANRRWRARSLPRRSAHPKVCCPMSSRSASKPSSLGLATRRDIVSLGRENKLCSARIGVGLCRPLDIDFRESASRHSGEYNLRKSAREVGKRRAQEVEESSPILPNTLTVRMLYESRIEAWGNGIAHSS